jgi:hypothetical protein
LNQYQLAEIFIWSNFAILVISTILQLESQESWLDGSKQLVHFAAKWLVHAQLDSQHGCSHKWQQSAGCGNNQAAVWYDSA